ncbi:Uncharacterised protein [Serratia fonticola]|nr:Uncharacterised protein [Serratia fonticola]
MNTNEGELFEHSSQPVFLLTLIDQSPGFAARALSLIGFYIA